jgi:hypothetical protein
MYEKASSAEGWWPCFTALSVQGPLWAFISTADNRINNGSKYPPAEPEALRFAGPSKGPYRDPKSKSQAPGPQRWWPGHLNRETYCWSRQTFAASPAEPGGLPYVLVYSAQVESPLSLSLCVTPTKHRRLYPEGRVLGPQGGFVKPALVLR